MKYALTMKEVHTIMKQWLVKIDGQVRRQRQVSLWPFYDSFALFIRDAPDTDFVGYPATVKAGYLVIAEYQISGRISCLKNYIFMKIFKKIYVHTFLFKTVLFFII